MYPTLLSIDLNPIGIDLVLDFHAYTVALSLAFLSAVLLGVWQIHRLPKPYPVTPIGGIWVFIGALIGSKVWWILQYDSIANLPAALVFWRGGLVFYGGLVGGILAAILYLKSVGAPVIATGDVAIQFVPLAHAIGRMGCFLNGCCYGRPSEVPWAVHYGPESMVYGRHISEHLIEPGAAHSAAVHPVQLYSVAALVGVFLIMRWAWKRPHRTGSMLLLYPFLDGLQRFTTEFFRGESLRSVAGVLTASQTVALLMVLGSTLTYLVLRASVWRHRALDTPFEEIQEKQDSSANADAV